jgi:hypothetical protein
MIPQLVATRIRKPARKLAPMTMLTIPHFPPLPRYNPNRANWWAYGIPSRHSYHAGHPFQEDSVN